jgi:hypothetical protein
MVSGPGPLRLAHGFINPEPSEVRSTVRIKMMKGYFPKQIGTADLEMDGHNLTGLTSTLVDGTAARTLVRRRHKLLWAPASWPMLHKNGFGFFLQHHGDMATSFYSPLDDGRRRWRLAVIGGFSVRRWPVVALSGGSLAWPRPRLALSRPPLASSDNELARAAANSCTRGLLGFSKISNLWVKIWSM